MGREGEWLEQPPDSPVDVARWRADEEFGIYPEGARDKSLLYSPAPAPYPFLAPNHRYLFKHAFDRYPDQFWAEIIAYRVGCLLGVAVPPAFVAWNTDTGVCGALIEWFLGYPAEPEERYVPGGDIMSSIISGYERMRGHQHNFQGIERYLSILETNEQLVGDWLGWWCDTLLFDALIGNTDRHQDNWGLLWKSGPAARMAPAFDNGTSLGHEIFADNMPAFSDSARIRSYIARGAHHMRWDIADGRPARHPALIQRLLERYPDRQDQVINRLHAFNVSASRAMITGMTEFNIPVPLSPQRADFVCRLIEARYSTLLHALTKLP